jgi:hypothetical protein
MVAVWQPLLESVRARHSLVTGHDRLTAPLSRTEIARCDEEARTGVRHGLGHGSPVVCGCVACLYIR